MTDLTPESLADLEAKLGAMTEGPRRAALREGGVMGFFDWWATVPKIKSVPVSRASTSSNPASGRMAQGGHPMTQPSPDHQRLRGSR